VAAWAPISAARASLVPQSSMSCRNVLIFAILAL
jgi:hypothetical protein